MKLEPRHQLLFDSDWRFARGDVDGAEAVAFDDADWRRLNLPHDWSIEGPFSEDAPCGGGGGYLPGGVGWYRKRFTLPDQDRDKRVTIQFDGVYKNCDVWLNGQRLGFHPGMVQKLGNTFTLIETKSVTTKSKVSEPCLHPYGYTLSLIHI